MQKLKFNILLTLISLLVPLALQAAGTNESSGALKELAEKVKLYTLPNGLRVIMYKRGAAPVFAGVVSVRVGGTDEHPGDTGISHMLEHMAFKGTPSIGTKNYKREVELLAEQEEITRRQPVLSLLSAEDKDRWEKINAELKEIWILGALSLEYDKRGSSDMNATTDKELTNYFTNMPRNAFEFWCWIESERILNPVMRQFYAERDVVLEERRMRFEDDPQGKLYEMLLGLAYMKHPYRNPVIGYEYDVSKLTATRVADFHKKYYVPSNIVVSVVGSVDPDNDIKIIEKYFGRIPSGPAPTHTNIQEGEQEGERRFTLETKAFPQLYVAYRKPNYPHPDDPPLSVMAEILVGSKISPLYKELVKNSKVASEVGYYESPGQAYPNLMMIFAATNTPHTNQDVLKGIDEVIERFKENGITEEDLEIAKRSVAMEYLGHLKSNMSLAKDFAESEAIFNNWKASLEWYEELMKVSVVDVNRVSRQYLTSKNRTIGMIENNAPTNGGKSDD